MPYHSGFLACSLRKYKKCLFPHKILYLRNMRYRFNDFNVLKTIRPLVMRKFFSHSEKGSVETGCTFPV